MFIVDWSEEDFGDLNFYDMYDILYPKVNGQYAPYVADDNLSVSAVYQIPKEEFESEEGIEILKSLGIEGDYEGIGRCILGYADGPAPKAAPRKDSYVYHID